MEGLRQEKIQINAPFPEGAPAYRQAGSNHENRLTPLLPPHAPLSRQKLCHNRNPREEAVGFQSFRMRVLFIMGNRRLYKAECIHMLGTLESEHLKVTALNLFHPTASSPFQ